MFNGGRDGFYHIKLVLHLPMQSMPLVNKIASSISFDWVRVAHLFIFCVPFFCFVFVFVLYIVGTMLPVSLDCQFSIARSVISNVYLPHKMLSSSPYHGKKSNHDITEI
jgi:hypothetical protein